MIKVTNNELKNTYYEKKQIFYAGYCELDNCRWYNAFLINRGIYGWNYSAMIISNGFDELCIMSGYRNMCGRRLSNEQIQILEKFTNAYEALDYLLGL